jgi:transglutaminase-like putative cysteine protease
VVPTAAAVLLGVVAYLVLPLGSAPTLGGSLLGGPAAQQSAAERAAQVTTTYFNGSLDLSARGHLPETPAFDVPVGSDGLWRALTLSQVTDGTWFSTPEQATFSADDAGRISLPVDPAESGAPATATKDYAVRPISAWSVIAPGPPRAVSGVTSLAQWTSDAFALDAAVSPYTVTAAPRTDVDSLTRSGSGPDRTEAELVQLDPTTTQRTVDLAASIVGTTTDRVEQVRAVESWLRTHVRYQLDAPLPPDRQNAVDFLLFESHAGFCEHFAAAEAILLRSLAIPTRMATGYAASSREQSTPGWLTIRDSDAHAWVEVWIPGHGWVTSDPTAGSALVDPASEQSWFASLLSGWNRLWSSDSGRRTLALGVLLLAALGVAIGIPLRRRRAVAVRREAEARGATLEPLAAFARFRAALSADGHHLGPGDGLAEVRRLVTDPSLRPALDIVELTLYASTLPPSHVRVATAELLDRRTAALTARRATAVPTG